MPAAGDPSPTQRLRYGLGGRLPAGQRDWVRHDLTDAGWRVRGLLRSLGQALPFAVVFALLPGPTSVHVLAPVLLLSAVAFTSAAYGDDLRNRRLRQHDLPVPGREPPPHAY